MLDKRRFAITYSLTIFAIGVAVGTIVQPSFTARAQTGGGVFELRTYTASEGKLDELHARFRDHTIRIFANHGITNIGYWAPQDAPLSENTLVYILAYPSREAAQQSWDAFRQDPEWRKVVAESQVDGRLVSNVESVFMDATDYSPMR